MRNVEALLLSAVIGTTCFAACGPSQPANTGDGAGAEAPLSSASASAEPSSSGGADAGAGAGGATSGAGGSGGEAAAGGAGGGTSAAPQTPAQLVAAAKVDAGAKLYEQEHCNGCHGTKAKPSAKFPNLFKVKWDDAKIEAAFALVKKGKTPMPGYGDKLNDQQIADIVAYLKAGK